jgi:hypothetical protein
MTLSNCGICHNDDQHNDILQNYARHDEILHNWTKQVDIQYTTQCNGLNCDTVQYCILYNCIIDIQYNCDAECRYDECRYVTPFMSRPFTLLFNL